jgi:PAS domain S-box-containing protein
MDNHLNQIRNKLIDAALLGVMVLLIPLLISSLLRIFQTGWQWLYLVHIITVILCCIAYMIRHKFSIAFKTHFSCFIFLIIFFGGAAKFSVSSGCYFSLMSVALSTLIYGKRWGYIYFAISVAGLAIIGFLHNTHIITTGIDFNIYNSNITTWLNVVIALVLIQLLLILSIGLYQDFFIQNIVTLEQKSREEAIVQKDLQLSEDRYRLLISNASIPIIISNFKGDLLFLNEAAEKLFDLKFEDLEEKNVTRFWSNINVRNELIHELKLHGVYQNIEVELLDKNHNPITVLITSNVITFKGETAILKFINDITAHKNAENFKKKNEELKIEMEKAEIAKKISKEFISELTSQEEHLQNLNTELRELANHLQTVREEERVAIAKEIHDQLAQNLVALSMNAAYIKNSVREKNSKVLEAINEQMEIADNVIKTSRTLFNALHPTMLEDLGLEETIKWYANDQLKAYHLKVVILSESGDFKLSREINIPLFRIFQDILSNVKLHSKATELTVVLTKNDEILTMSVEDNGVGFETKSINILYSHGLLVIRERVYAINGKLNIHSIKGKGTQITVSVPLQ